MTWLELFVYGLACFRLAVLLSQDAGPARMFQRFRGWLKREAKQHPAVRKTAVHEGIDCLKCSSIWIAGPVAAYAYRHDSMSGWFVVAGDVSLLCMALSALAILWHRAFPAR